MLVNLTIFVSKVLFREAKLFTLPGLSKEIYLNPRTLRSLLTEENVPIEFRWLETLQKTESFLFLVSIFSFVTLREFL